MKRKCKKKDYDKTQKNNYKFHGKFPKNMKISSVKKIMNNDVIYGSNASWVTGFSEIGIINALNLK